MARNSYFNENTLEELLEEIKYVYQSDKRPWVIGYSGGKDSTTVVELVYKMLQMLPKEERNKNVYIVSSDTLIENPLIKIYLSKMNKLLGEAAKKDDLPIISTMVTPPADNSFWANVIGRGFPTPRINGTFRWCTDRLKINPSANYIRNVIKKEGEEVVVLLGVRKAESEARRRRIEGRELANRLMNRHETIQDAYVYNPIVELTTEDVWEVLLRLDGGKTPWGSNPSSKYYCKATHAKNAVEEAREKVAKLLGANPDEIIFTAGATESTNFIIKGYLDYRKFYGDGKNHVITSLVEHKATLKLQNSTLLVLIKDIDSTNSDAVEQIFLDINEKSKRLDNASIFKGYCFKIYDEAFQDELKCLWIRLKKAYISFKNFSGENYKFDEYIYMYLLVTEDENMTENLSPGGIHFLEDKNMDDVERILTKMVEYGERVSDFYKHIQNEAYIFEDICVDSNSYKTASKKLITNVKEYLLYSMETKSAQYQKVPLNWFIYSVKDKSNNMNILMKDFMTITANLYIYSFLFTLSPSKKSKKNIDHSLYNVLNEDVDIKQIINIVKELRKKQVENVQIPENCRSFDVLSNLYTIMDCFKVKENRFDVTYHNHGGQLYTLEHFIVPDNRNAKIKWLTKDEESIEISFTGQSERKKKLINYLIVEQKLNNDILLDFDVIKKIELISDYYGNATPKHVGIITAHIENMESYKELKKLKNEEDEKEVENIRNCYNSFLDEYFSDNNQRTILNKLLEGLKLTFINS